MNTGTDKLTSMNVSLPESLRRFAEERASDGYTSISEYLRELLRQDQRRTAQERLETLLLEGLDSGETVDAKPEFWADLKRELRERVTERARNAK